MKKLLLVLFGMMFCISYAFAETPLRTLSPDDVIVSNILSDEGSLLKKMDMNSDAAKAMKQVLLKNGLIVTDTPEAESGIGIMSVANSRAVPTDSEIEYLLLAGPNPGITDMALYKIPNSYCYDQYPYPKVEPVDGLLMYTTGIYQATLRASQIPFQYISNFGIGNVVISPSVWTEYVKGNGPDTVLLFRFTNVEPYASDNTVVIRNEWQRPDNPAEYVSDPTLHGNVNIGCHMVITANGNEVVPGNPYVWIIMQQADDAGDELFFASNFKQNVFESESYSRPIWTLYFDRKETNHYVYKIRHDNNRNAFIYSLENWLYFTIIDNGLTYIQKFLPF